MNIDDLLRAAVAKGASDLHSKVGAYPMVRVAGMLVPVSEEKRLMNEDTLAMGAPMMSPEQRDKFTKSQEVDLAYSVAGLGRFRVQRLPAARHDGHGAARHSDEDSDDRRPAAAAGASPDLPTKSAASCW